MTLWTPGSFVDGIFQERILEWVAISSSREYSQCRAQTCVSCIAGRFFIHWITAATTKSLQSCPTLCDSIDSSPPGSSVPGISRQEYWGGMPFPSPPGIGFSNHYYFQPNLVIFNGFLTHTKHTSFTGIKVLNVKTKMFLLLFLIEECLFEIREGNS